MTEIGVQRTDLAVSGLLFDNDGVLIDSTTAVEASWRTFASWYDLPESEVLPLVHGRRSRDVISHFAGRLPIPADDAFDRYIRHCLEHPEVSTLPGARELLTALPPRHWAIVTSGTAIVTRARLAAAGLPEPPLLITAEDVSAGKPNPAPYRTAAERLGLNPHDCLAIEDTPTGLTSARRAGCHTLALFTTHHSDTLDADHTATDLTAVDVTMSSDTFRITVTRSG